MYANSISLSKDTWRFFAVLLFLFAVLGVSGISLAALDTQSQEFNDYCSALAEQCEKDLFGGPITQGEKTEEMLQKLIACVLEQEPGCGDPSPDESGGKGSGGLTGAERGEPCLMADDCPESGECIFYEGEDVGKCLVLPSYEEPPITDPSPPIGYCRDDRDCGSNEWCSFEECLSDPSCVAGEPCFINACAGICMERPVHEPPISEPPEPPQYEPPISEPLPGPERDCGTVFYECAVDLFGQGWERLDLPKEEWRRAEECVSDREPEMCGERLSNECERIMEICHGDPICWEKEALNVPGRLDCGGGDEWDRRDGRGREGDERGFDDHGCAQPVVHACVARCEVSDVFNCVESCLTNKECGGEGPRRRGEEQGCRPFTREDAKWKLREMGGEVDPGEVEQMYKNMTKAWVTEVNREHGVQLSPSDVEGFPSCPRGPQGPGGPPGLRGPEGHPSQGVGPPEYRGFEKHGRDPDDFRGRGSESIGEIFGRAVGMLVQLTQEDFLDANQRAVVTAALRWFGEQLVNIATADDIGPIVLEAKEKLREVMDLFEGGFGFDPERFKNEMGRVREEIMGVLNDAAMMLKMIPEAFRIMEEEFGYPVPGWEPIYEGLDGILADARQICEKALDTKDFKRFEECGDALHRFFEDDMEKLTDLVERSGVPEDVMDEVGRRMGFDDQEGRDEEYYGPSGDYTGNPMREFMEECLELGGDQEDCERRVMEKFGGQRGPRMPRDYERSRGPMDFGPEGKLDSERMMRIIIDCMESGGSEQECKEELFQMFAPSSEDFRGDEDYGDFEDYQDF